MARERVTDQPAFLLHSVPYSETSLVLDLLTRDHGRVAALAKGAKRPRSALRAVLLQFQPLLVGYSGRNELRTLTGADWQGGLDSPRGHGLMSAFYLNELLMRLVAREDPHPAVFEGYELALRCLALGAPLETTLRRFEWLLLRETGVAPDLLVDTTNEPIEADKRYIWLPTDGFMLAATGVNLINGQTLLSLAKQEFENVEIRQQAKQLTRRILNHCLDGYPLSTRKIMQDLHKHEILSSNDLS